MGFLLSSEISIFVLQLWVESLVCAQACDGGTQVDFFGFVSGSLHIDSNRLLKSLQEKNQEKLSQLLRKAVDDAGPFLDSFSGCYQDSCCVQCPRKASGAD